MEAKQLRSGRRRSTAVGIWVSLAAVVAAAFAAAGPAPVQITSFPDTTTRQTAATFAFSAELGKDRSFICSLDRLEWRSCSSPITYSELAVGSHEFSVGIAKKQDLVKDSTASYSWVVEPTPPTSTESPTLSGVAEVGQTLTASSGAWTGTPPLTYAYQWLGCDPSGDNCVAVADATSPTHTISAAALGLTFRVRVAATNAAGTTSALSQPSGRINHPPRTATPPTNTALPTVSGELLVGQTITASSGAWTGTPPLTYAYQWLLCDPSGDNCIAVADATSPTRTISAAALGLTVRVRVTATNTAGTTSALSQPSSRINPPPPSATQPTSITATVILAKRIPLYSRNFIAARVSASRAATALWTLRGATGRVVRIWQTRLRPGESTLFLERLAAPPSRPLPRSGLYILAAKITGNGEPIFVQRPISLIRTSGWPMGRAWERTTNVTVVDTLVTRSALVHALGDHYVVGTASERDISAVGATRSPCVLVVPAAGHLVRDLRLILPESRIVAVARTPAEAAGARRDGARAVLSGSPTALLIAHAVAALE